MGKRKALTMRKKRSSKKAKIEKEDIVYEVEKILGIKVERGVTEYEIKWKGYDEISWEPESYIVNCDEAIEDFKNRKVKRQKKEASTDVKVLPKVAKKHGNTDKMKILVSFMANRHEVYTLKADGKPYNNIDEFMDKHHFCNVFRELDRGTRYFQSQVKALENKPDRTTLIRMAVAYRLVNKVATFEQFGGIPTTARKVEELKKFMRKMRAQGVSCFTGAHQNNGHEKYYKTMTQLESNMDALKESCENMETFFNAITKVYGVGGFFGQQITCDLMESGALGGSENDWVGLGPGAVKGLKILFPSLQTGEELEKAKWLHENQESIFAKYNLKPPKLEGKELTLKNIEHCLCEFQKYYAVYTGKTNTKLRVYRPKEKLL